MNVPALLDTDTVSFLLRGESRVLGRAEEYRRTLGPFQISVLTHYEILKGLEWKDARRKLELYGRLVRDWTIRSVDPPSATRAARIHAASRRAGRTRPDIDVLIAATALAHGLAVVTHNAAHYRGIEDLVVIDWMA